MNRILGLQNLQGLKLQVIPSKALITYISCLFPFGITHEADQLGSSYVACQSLVCLEKCCYLREMLYRAWPGAAVDSKWPLEPGPLHSTPLHFSTSLHSTPLYSTPHHSIPLRSIPPHSIPVHSMPLHATPLHTISPHPTPLLHSAPLQSSTPHHSTLLNFHLSSCYSGTATGAACAMSGAKVVPWHKSILAFAFWLASQAGL